MFAGRLIIRIRLDSINQSSSQFAYNEESTMKKTVTAALLCCSALAAVPAEAATFYDTSRGFYDGIKVGAVNYDLSNVSNNSQAGYGLLLGYNFSPNFGAEIEYTLLGGFDSADSNIKGRALSMSLVGTLPLNQQFSLYGKMGIATTTLRESPRSDYPGPDFNTYTYNNTDLTFGFGGLLNVTPVIGIRAGFDFYEVAGCCDTYSTSIIGLTALFKF
jgi:OOP family OmpA-OmpF porin